VTLAEEVRRGGSWNIFHPPTGLKIDLLTRQDTPYDREAFAAPGASASTSMPSPT
jgi:hypothetical protein